jgi:hypothetical protein
VDNGAPLSRLPAGKQIINVSSETSSSCYSSPVMRLRYVAGVTDRSQHRVTHNFFAMPDAAFRFLLQSFQATR